MYLHQEALSTSHVHDPFGATKMVFNGDIERAVLRGRKMRSEAFWNLFPALGRAIAKAWRAYANYRKAQKAAQALRQMDARMLADIGLTPSDIDYAVTHGRHHPPVSEVPMVAVPSADAANDTHGRQAA